MNSAPEIAGMDIGLLGAPAAMQRKLVAGESAPDSFGNHAMQQLPRAIGVRATYDVHWEFQKPVHGIEIHVECDLRGRIGTRRLDRLVLFGAMLDRAIHL